MIRRTGFFRDLGGASFMHRILCLRRDRVKRLLPSGILGAAIFCLFLFSGCQTGGAPSPADQVDETPTPIHFDAQPVPTLLPRTNLYLFFQSDRPLYYREGEYFQYWHSHWFAADDLRGPWNPIKTFQLPDLLQSVPPDYYYDNFPYKLRKEK